MAGTQSISKILNDSATSCDSSGSLSRSAYLSSLWNSVAAVQLQLSTLECANYDCGEGFCAVVSYIPMCNCDVTGYTGSHCQLPVYVANGSDAQGIWLCAMVNNVCQNASCAGVAATHCPSVNSLNCSGHGVCVSVPPSKSYSM